MINIPKGTKDVLPGDAHKWQWLEAKARETASAFCFREIRTPVFEHTELFARGVGDTTDIVNKEMYTFLDKGGRSMTLKPEGTAGVARSFVENGMAGGVLPAKMFYITPVFRYERPQAGRLREHHQFGVEAYGAAGADMDAEVIVLAHAFLTSLGVRELELNINSIGCPDCRKTYNEALKDYFRPLLPDLCETCRGRFEKNPLRMLDCKEPGCQAAKAGAPRILDYLCGDCAAHFETLKTLLAAAGLTYRVNPSIVRGLDYYTRTVFEFVSTNIGSQGTVCGGGRYDGLLASIGGPSVPGVGFGLGLERLLLLLENTGAEIPAASGPEVYFAPMGRAAREKCFALVAELRRAGARAECDHMDRSVKAQFKYADKIGAGWVIAVGDNELGTGRAAAKPMRGGEPAEVALDAAGILALLRKSCANGAK